MIGVSGLAASIATAAEPLPAPEDPGFGPLFDRFGSADIVLLGEASHGTSEFYRARAAITRRLIEQHGFTIVALEADWPDAAALNRRVRGLPARLDDEASFTRFPTWMWRNREMDGFLHWLEGHNRGRAPAEQAGLYGLDLYNLNASIRGVLAYLDEVDPEAAAVARRRYGCLAPWREEPQRYGRMALSRGFAPCEAAVVEALQDLLARALSYSECDEGRFLDAAGNARLVKDAEAYYRAMYYSSAESWNLRDRHMAETLASLLDSKGPSAKAIVWAHNSHIGDASATEMGRRRHETNVGQLVRERWGARARLVGFGTHTGTVAAADDWDEPMRIIPVNPSRPDSVERLMHDSGVPRFLLDLRELGPDLRAALAEPRLERMIGVIYRPDTERWSHYVEAVLPEQFDSFVWFDETRAVSATAPAARHGPDETYPSGL